MERIVGFVSWKKKPGVTVFTLADGSGVVKGQEAKTRFFAGEEGNTNYQKINEGSIGAAVQWQFVEGFGNQLKIVDCKLSKA